MKYRVRRIYATIVFATALAICAPMRAERPQLVIGIVADQLQTDYLHDLLPLMSKEQVAHKILDKLMAI